MEKAIVRKETSWITFICLSLLGCGLITLSSFIRIPFYPVPFTLQTLAISILALTQSPKQALGSTICYLLLGSLGLPVFGGHANLFWLIGHSGGYLIGFAIAAYVSSKMYERFSAYTSLLFGMAIIYLFGFLWLAPTFGPSVALMQGIVFFLPSDLLKNLVAVQIASSWKKWGKK